MSKMEIKKRTNPVNLVVRESITEALLSLMKCKDFSDITVSELTKKAGVGRVSFYRNFESKEDVLKQHMASLSNNYWRSHHAEDPATLWKITFDLFEILKPVVLLIHKSNIDSVFYAFIKDCTKPHEAESAQEGFYRAMFTGLAFGLYDQWLSTGMKETPEELAEMFRQVVLPYTRKEVK